MIFLWSLVQVDIVPWEKVRRKPNVLINVFLVPLLRGVQEGPGCLEESVEAFP